MIKLRQILIPIFILFEACNNNQENRPLNQENFENREVVLEKDTTLESGKSYLSIYSQIYSLSEHQKHNLTAMVSLRNINDTDSVYILKANYYDTHGKIVNKYIKKPIYLAPLETIEIIIDEIDVSGGTGSNFVFEWSIPENCQLPLFEGVMSSTKGQQGLSFTTQAVRIE